MIRYDKWYEKEPFNAFWEKAFAEEGALFSGGVSFELLEILPALPKNAKVLDLGCGDGKNSLFLAKYGCDVTAIDRSPQAINKLRSLATKLNVRISADVGDIRTYNIHREYDLIMSHGVLFCLTRDEWQDLLNRVIKKTKDGGINIHATIIFNKKYPILPEFAVAHYMNSFRQKELGSFYKNWTNIRYDIYVKWDRHPGLNTHCHPIEKLVVQKGDKPSFRIKKLRLSNSSISQQLFNSITIDTSNNDFFACCGKPDLIQRFIASADYCFELLYYGKYVFYMVNSNVVGKAIFFSKPTMATCII